MHRKVPGTLWDVSHGSSYNNYFEYNKTIFTLTKCGSDLKKQNHYNNTIVDEHTLFYIEDIYGKKIEQCFKIKVQPQS